MFEKDETRIILNKRRKRPGPIEEVCLDDFDDIFSDTQKEVLFYRKK